MVAIVNQFGYTGTVLEVTVPPGTISIDVYLWGGAGGGGGPDDNPGGPGTGGHFMKHIGYTGTGAASIASNIGNTLQVAVGGAGGGGSSGGGAPGGSNGKGLTDYSGGTGGSAGPRPYSGGGGGGGGATVVTLNGTAIHIAGGGGGGGGAGNHSGSTPGINTNNAHGQSPSTLGQNGGNHTGDGGGGGAGGGGFTGGSGGSGGSGDNTGAGGYSGLSLVQTGGVSVLASGTTPGGTGEAYYHGGSVGGNPAGAGSNGAAVIVFNVGVQANTKKPAETTSVSSSATTSSEVYQYLQDSIDGKATNNNGWIVIDPPLTNSVWQGFEIYNQDIFIDFQDKTLYAGTNETDTTITSGDKTFVRGSLRATNSAVGLVYYNGGSSTHSIKYYDYTMTSAAGWKSINNMYTKVSGAWKQITAGYVKVAGAWKSMFNSGIDFTSTANGFGNATGVSGASSGSGGGGCFIAGTLVTMADGSQKAVELVDIGDEVAVGGKVFATGKFLIDNLYEYKGVQVSGTHMVKEDGKWTRVENSKHGVSLGNDDAIVYVFGSENRRIIIEGIEFTDYFELSEQQELVNHGEQFFSNWQDHDRQIHDKNVNILNA